jgi:CO dehydrogenase/acetyl-CoA synthase delta subunit
MSQYDFATALEQFSNVDPNQAIETLFKLFQSIHNMNAQDLCAAKDTIDCYTSVASLNEEQQELINTLIEACCSRAHIIMGKDFGFDDVVAKLGYSFDYNSACITRYRLK